MRTVYVAGVGMTPFGKFPDTPFHELGRQALEDTIGDAGIDRLQIEIAYAGHARTGQLLGWECGVGQMVLLQAGVTEIPVVSVGNYCASGTTAFYQAWLSVATGQVDVALALGLEKMSVRSDRSVPFKSDGAELEGSLGFSPPIYFAQVAQEHMRRYGTTREQLAAVAVKNRRHAGFNPRAQYRKPLTEEEVMVSKVVADPLTLFDCCPTGDGAAAALLVSSRMASRLGRAQVKVGAVALSTGGYRADRDITSWQAAQRAARTVYEKSGIGPKDVNVAEVHDCFTIAELMACEDLGFCPVGQAGPFTAAGQTTYGGKLVVNTSGGLLSKGHPLGATGLAQVAEVTWQLRGQAGERQAVGARVGMTHTVGGFIDGDSASVGVSLLYR